MLTQDTLKEVMRYEPETGLLYRIAEHTRSGKLKPVKERITGRYTKKGYLSCGIRGKSYLVHRLIFLYMTGSLPTKMVDHINGNRSDNRWTNLRLADIYQNGFNRGKQRDNKSGYKGVVKRKNRWIAQMTFHRHVIHLGMFATKEEAAKCYNDNAILYHGEFANLNVIS